MAAESIAIGAMGIPARPRAVAGTRKRRAGFIKRFLRRARAWFRPGIETLGSLIQRAHKARHVPIDGLYVLQLDSAIPPPMAAQLLTELDPIREKYGIDFIVLEPGMSIRRFDEF